MEVIIWIAILVVAIVIDYFTSTFLFSWIGIGSIVAIIFQGFGYNIGVQIVAFSITSFISVLLGYNFVTKKIKTNIKRLPLMEENYIGNIYTAEEDIEKNTMIKVEGVYWTGYNIGEKISKGQKFEIAGINGNKLLIKKC